MKLFTFNDLNELELNKPWIHLIPEFKALLVRDKGSKGDYRGDLKLKAKKEFTYLYFSLDFSSPFKHLDEFERRTQSMQAAGLTETDMDEALQSAYRRYDEMLLNSSRSLKTLRSLKKGLDALDEYYETINFNETDGKGALKHSPNSFINNVKQIGPAYDAVEKFEKRVEEELSGNSGIRGQATLGGKEGKRENSWKEGKPKETESTTTTSKVVQTDFSSIAALLKDSGETLTEES
jgi:hypothetical protein